MFYSTVVLFLLASFCTADLSLQIFPTWITNNPAFQAPIEIDSTASGNGSIEIQGRKNFSWVIHLSNKSGYGVEIEIEKLSINSKKNDFVMITGWPPNPKYNQIKFYIGTHSGKRIRIPLSKSFLVLYSATENLTTPELKLKYKRYGVSLERNPSTTERPPLKETLYDVPLKGINPEKYKNSEFLANLKKAIRTTAKTFCLNNNISFNDSILTNKMVLIHRVSCCPFEWPDRDICASVLHSVFVSGTVIPGEELIMNYELTADHLESMWAQADLPELKKLGLTDWGMECVFAHDRETLGVVSGGVQISCYLIFAAVSTIQQLTTLAITPRQIIGAAYLVRHIQTFRRPQVGVLPLTMPAAVWSAKRLDMSYKVFKLPHASDAILCWTLIIAVVMLASLVGILIFWGANKHSVRLRKEPPVSDYTSWKKAPKLKVKNHQQIPAFMSKNHEFGSKIFEDTTALKPDVFHQENSKLGAPRPIKNYYGGLLFRDNESFENDEESTMETRPK